MTEDLDTGIGQLLQRVEQLGISDNTYIIYTSDNGGKISSTTTDNSPLFSGKGGTWEGGVRVPMIVKGPGVEAGFPGQFWIGVGGHAVGRCFLEGIGCRVHADVYVGWLPAVSGVDVAWAGGRDADQVGQRAKENVVAGSGPRFVEVNLIVGGQVGVEEEVDGLPSSTGGDLVGLQCPVEVVAAVGVPWVTHVVVVLGITGGIKSVVPSDCVLDNLQHGTHVDLSLIHISEPTRPL